MEQSEDPKINLVTKKNEVRMSLRKFLDLVEIRTKVASIIPFITGVVYTLYRYRTFKLDVLLLFFFSMLCVDMATTAMNHLADSNRAINKSGYNYESHNAVIKYKLDNKMVKFIILLLLIMGSLSGMKLFLMTDLVILFSGIFAFGVGILYSNGPIPISSIPLGEFTSGVLMGGLIFFVTVYMQIFDMGFIIYQFNHAEFTLKLNFVELGAIVFASIPMILMISNIMLSNNICDLEDDIINKRFTLPYYMGKEKALMLYEWSYYFCYITIIFTVILNWIPATALLALLTFIPIRKNIKEFKETQDKATTFSLAIKNFFLLGFSYIFSIAISLFGIL